MIEVKNYFIQGAVLIDVDGAALNNQGVDKRGMTENTILTKAIK